MARILLVDDSPSVRQLLSRELRSHGFDVEDFAEATSAAERALAAPPHLVVTDLWMPGLSGVQLCRLLRSEPTTAHVPVILLSASSTRKARFWARSAGAVAFVDKSNIGELLTIIENLYDNLRAVPPPAAAPKPSGSIAERLSALLDAALFESVIAGRLRALGHTDGDLDGFFAGLVDLAADVLGYRWLALAIEGEAQLFLHTHSGLRGVVADEARIALGLDGGELITVADDRALSASFQAAVVQSIDFASRRVGRLAIGPAPRHDGEDHDGFLRLCAAELGGPLRMLRLVRDSLRLAGTDALTGAMNRRAFLDAMAREHSRAKRAHHQNPLSLILLDVDHFKQINDTRGHAAGDKVLANVAHMLARMARRSDLVARWGGEEFIVALPDTGSVGARIAAERIRRSLAELVHELPGVPPFKVTASLGVVSASGPWTTEDLITAADHAMYAAKGRGRNRVEVASEPPVA